MLGATAAIAAVYVSVRYYIPFPFEDQWAVIEGLYRNHGTYTVPLLWAVHNEHRLPFAKLLMTADLFWFQGQNLSLYIEIYLFQILHLGIFYAAMRRGAKWPAWLVAVGSGLATFALFWTSQFQSFLNPFGVSVLPAYIFASLAIFAMLFAVEDGRHTGRWFAVSLLAAFLSEASMANGLLTWPLLLLLALRWRLRPAFVACLAVVGAFCIWLFFIDFHPDAAARSLRRMDLVADYLLVYFGSVWLYMELNGWRVLAGLGIVCGAACFVWELTRPKTNRFAVAVLSIWAFLLGTGFITALGRVIYPLMQAASSRYQSSALLFWLCLALYALDACYRRGPRSTMLAALAALVLFTAIVPGLPATLAFAYDMDDRITGGGLPLYSDVEDHKEIWKLFVRPDLVFEMRPFLRANQTTFYADRRYRRIGKPLQSTFRIAPNGRCIGSVDYRRRIDDPQFPGWELYGWVWDTVRKQRAVGIVTAVGGTTIRGMGEPGLARPDVPRALGKDIDPRVGWHAYVQGPGTLPGVQVYALVDGGKTACAATPAFDLGSFSDK